MSRPVKEPHEKRNANLPAVRVLLSERLYVDEQASNAGLTTSDYIRTLALTEEVKPRKTKIEQSLLVELNRIGVNINQIAHAANIGRTDEAILKTALNELIHIMEKVDHSL